MPNVMANLEFVENAMLDLVPHPDHGQEQDVRECTQHPRIERITGILTHDMRGGIRIGVSYRVPGSIGGLKQYMAEIPEGLSPDEVNELLEEAGDRCDEQHAGGLIRFFGL